MRILTEPRYALTKQYVALLETEGIELVFEESGVALIAEYAALANDRMENIGARRLHTLLERALDEILFEGAELDDKKQVIDANFIEQAVADVVKDPDLSRYIL